MVCCAACWAPLACTPCRSYKQALRTCPSCPPEVRLGIASCCLKLGNTVKAELAYRRTLELSPNCTPALLGLAVLKLHVSNEEAVRPGLCGGSRACRGQLWLDGG